MGARQHDRADRSLLSIIRIVGDRAASRGDPRASWPVPVEGHSPGIPAVGISEVTIIIIIFQEDLISTYRHFLDQRRACCPFPLQLTQAAVYLNHSTRSPTYLSHRGSERWP